MTSSSLCSSELLRLFNEVGHSNKTLHQIWDKSGFRMSLRSAYRWYQRWLRSFGHLRSQLRRDYPPPDGNESSSVQMLRHFEEAFGQETESWVASFQERYQRGFFA